MPKRVIFYLIVFMYSALSTCGETALIHQFHNFEFINSFRDIIGEPDKERPLVIKKADAKKYLFVLSDHLLKESISNEKIREIIFGLEDYYIQISKIISKNKEYYVFSAYKDDVIEDEPLEYWSSADGGGVLFWTSSINVESGSVIINYDGKETSPHEGPKGQPESGDLKPVKHRE